jgi:hypothetical protein
MQQNEQDTAEVLEARAMLRTWAPEAWFHFAVQPEGTSNADSTGVCSTQLD